MEKIYVIKIGGNIIDDEKSLQDFLRDFASIPGKKILVHGGGKIATRLGDQLGIVPNYVDGRRITDAATIDLVTMVYGGLINKNIVAKLQALECNSIGLTGADANIIPATMRAAKEIDFGFVGDIAAGGISINNLQTLLMNRFVPVFAPLTHNGKGQMLNTNADTIASALSVALSGVYEVRLVYCFEMKGVLGNIQDPDSVIHSMNRDSYQQLLSENKLAGGILPKIDNAFAALNNGVKEVLIGDATDLLPNCSDNIKGTLFS